MRDVVCSPEWAIAWSVELQPCNLAWREEVMNMAKNTGRNFRRGAVTGRTQVKTPSGYIKRNSANGRFMDVKSDSKPFKGVTQER